MDTDTKLINFALDAGEIMLKNGAETFRVQDTMQRILSVTGREKIEATAISTALIVTLPREEKGPLSMMRGVHTRSVNFEKVCEVNDISRAFVSKKITLDEAITKLRTIRQSPFYPLPLRVIAYGLISGGCSIMISENLLDGVLSFLIGMILGTFAFWLGTKKTPYFFEPFLGGALAAFCACLIHPLFPASKVETIVIGSIMPLLPGLTFSKSMRDLLEGNLISGSTKAVESLVVAFSVAGGVGLVLSYFM